MAAGRDGTSKRRQLGDESRRKILDAVAAIAGERGYEGTSMAEVARRAGLPVASIYWHFTNKDQLLAAVIDRGFERWESGTEWHVPPGTDPVARLAAMLARNTAVFATHDDFLRLGLMLTLERRPAEPTARQRFLEVRTATTDAIAAGYRDFWPELDDVQIERLARMTLLAGDGLFIALQADPGLSIPAFLDDVAVGLVALAERMIAG